MVNLKGIQILARNEVGVLRDITGIVAEKGGNITFSQSFIIESGEHAGNALIYLEVEEGEGDLELILNSLSQLPTIIEALEERIFKKVFGKRILIFGGGALVSQVAFGAISEADRHNLRGEHISIDTMPVIGEDELAEAVRAVARLHRAEVLILAGGLMGGKISEEIKRLREFGIPVIALNMFGSVPKYSDLVVNDPVMAGTLAAMHISEKGKFDIKRVKGKRV
ncbi:MAG: DUF5612 domain-containing protein [Archaeoglobaceae archaeon]